MWRQWTFRKGGGHGQEEGVPKYRLPPTSSLTTGSNTEVLLFFFHFPPHNHKLLCCRKRRALGKSAVREARRQWPLATQHSNLTLTVKSLWLVSFGHKSIPSSIIQPQPGEGGKGGDGYIRWAHVLTGSAGLVRRAGDAKLSADALRENPGHCKPGSNKPSPPQTTQWFLVQYPRNRPHNTSPDLTPLTTGVSPSYYDLCTRMPQGWGEGK